MWCKRELCKQAIASVKGSEASADDDTAAAANACRAIENLELAVGNLQALVLCNSSRAAKGGLLDQPGRASAGGLVINIPSSLSIKSRGYDMG
jgi:hypothetical protein